VTPLEVIHETNDYIVVNKAAGLISEKSSYEDCTVEVQVLNHLLEKNPKPFVGVIHRLDRVTSGVLIFAKKKRTLVDFNELFSSRKIQKTYLAIVKKKPQKNEDELHNFLVKNNLKKRADIVESKSKAAQECILSYEVVGQNDYGYLLEIKPKTGRFHQIRAQLSHIELPVIGDEKYGSDQEYLPLCICLHAWKLTYQVPGSEELKTFEAPLPKNDFWTFNTESTNAKSIES
jgi:23S rRNA pseudouridine1911/1915/1917 synthase